MEAALDYVPAWDDGIVGTSSEELATMPSWSSGMLGSSIEALGTTVPYTSAELNELAFVFDSTQASSTSTSPSMVVFATPPSISTPNFPGAEETTHTVSNKTSPSDISTPLDNFEQDKKRKRDRERNTEAARRYRKRRVDETDDLRARLDEMTRQRDELRLKLVKAETEADLLRNLVGQKSKS